MTQAEECFLFSLNSWQTHSMLAKKNRMKMSRGFLTILSALSIAVLALTWSMQAQSQHAMHGMSDMGDVSVVTMPANDAVLANSPDHVMLEFEDEITLVKLALKDPAGKLIDINFRFDPTPGKQFMHMLPELEQIDFYNVEWAFLDAEGMLVKGNFYFSFGEDAQPPSQYLEQMEMDMNMPMAPDYRLL